MSSIIVHFSEGAMTDLAQVVVVVHRFAPSRQIDRWKSRDESGAPLEHE